MNLIRLIWCFRGAMDLREAVRKRHLPAPEERRRRRVACEFSLRDIAEILGVAHSSVSRWELGVRTPRRRNRERYAEVLAELKELVN